MMRQRGQGLVEALLLVPVLLLCISAISWLGAARHSAMQAAQTSRVTAFAAARGDVPPAVRDGARLFLSRDRAGPVPGDGVRVALQQDWLRVDTRLLKAEAERVVSPMQAWAPLPTGAVSLHRQTSIAQAGGHAVSDMDAQQRIVDGRQGWKQVADASQALASRLRQRIAGVDSAWGNRKPDIDWVSAWSNLVPSEALKHGDHR